MSGGGRAYGPASCPCDFCTGRKLHADNWCARCGNVKLAPPKHWENLDVCDACETEIRAEIDAEEWR